MMLSKILIHSPNTVVYNILYFVHVAASTQLLSLVARHRSGRCPTLGALRALAFRALALRLATTHAEEMAVSQRHASLHR
jgi:hypothetical protein